MTSFDYRKQKQKKLYGSGFFPKKKILLCIYC